MLKCDDRSWLALIQQHRAIAVIRATQLEQGRHMSHSVARGGMRLIEITWNTDRAATLIEQLRGELPDCVIGAGTLLDWQQMQAAIDCGAQFLFSPHSDPHLIQVAVNLGVPIVPGALSPTEIVAAWQAGASSVKVFPVHSLGGVNYIRSLQAPLTGIPLIPTGGVTVENARSFLDAGAAAIGLSSSLFPEAAVATGNWEAIVTQAETLMRSVQAEQL